MESEIWNALLRKHGILRDDPCSWQMPLGSQLQYLRTHPVFEPIGGPLLVNTLDELIDRPRFMRVQRIASAVH
jgi:hypothetical protein